MELVDYQTVENRRKYYGDDVWCEERPHSYLWALINNVWQAVLDK